VNWNLLLITGFVLATMAACQGTTGQASPKSDCTGRVTFAKSDCKWEADPQNPGKFVLVCKASQSDVGGDTTGIGGGGH
jgi:hypothetical protein